MKSNHSPSHERVAPTPDGGSELLRLLILEAHNRGHTLTELARRLGVTYERLAQWRRNEASISNARREVLERSAEYLGIPTIFVLTLAGKIAVRDFIWPEEKPVNDRVGRELERLRLDPYIGPFIPVDLLFASPTVKLFVVFILHELSREEGSALSSSRWMKHLLEFSRTNTRTTQSLDAMRKIRKNDSDIF